MWTLPEERAVTDVEGVSDDVRSLRDTWCINRALSNIQSCAVYLHDNKRVSVCLNRENDWSKADEGRGNRDREDSGWEEQGTLQRQRLAVQNVSFLTWTLKHTLTHTFVHTVTHLHHCSLTFFLTLTHLLPYILSLSPLHPYPLGPLHSFLLLPPYSLTLFIGPLHPYILSIGPWHPYILSYS